MPNFNFNNPDVEPPRVCLFPSHYGETWIDVLKDDRRFIEWLVGGDGPKIDDDLYDYLVDLLEEP